jgi:hypothetical protein
MNQLSARSNALTPQLSPILIFTPPAIISASMWFTRGNPVTLFELGCSYMMLQVVFGSYLSWKQQNRSNLPLFATIAAVYWIYFVLAVFWGGRVIPTTIHPILISDEAAAGALAMAAVAVACIYAGMKIPCRWAKGGILPSISEDASSSWVYVRILVVVGTVAAFFPSLNFILGPSGRNPIVILLNIVPMVAFLLLLRRWIMGTASPIDKPLVIVSVVLRVSGGLAAGWLGTALTWVIAGLALFLALRRRIPWAALLVAVLSIVFLQAGKQAFRGAYWESGIQGASEKSGGIWERVQFWFDASVTEWSGALQENAPDRSTYATTAVLERASLLTQVAHVMEVTPEEVPFQQGGTYSYVWVSLIPRFLWPNKPSVSDANRYYQIAYGLSDERSLRSTSISVGSMAEGYINFGWLGVVVVMFGIGAILKIYEKTFLANRANALVFCIGIALIPQFIDIGSQLGQYLGGLVQEIGLTFLMFLPITVRRSRKVSPQAPIVRARVRSAELVSRHLQ